MIWTKEERGALKLERRGLELNSGLTNCMDACQFLLMGQHQFLTSETASLTQSLYNPWLMWPHLKRDTSCF